MVNKVKASVHPEALAALKKYKGDVKAGHLDAAEYWRGQAGAYFTANPKGVSRMNPELNGYVGFYRGKRYEVYASTSYEAQQKIAKEHKVKKPYEITIVLAEKESRSVTHPPLMNPKGVGRMNPRTTTPEDPVTVRYIVFAGREGRLTTKEKTFKTEKQMSKFLDNLQASGNLYQVLGFSPSRGYHNPREYFTANPKGGNMKGHKSGCNCVVCNPRSRYGNPGAAWHEKQAEDHRKNAKDSYETYKKTPGSYPLGSPQRARLSAQIKDNEYLDFINKNYAAYSRDLGMPNPVIDPHHQQRMILWTLPRRGQAVSLNQVARRSGLSREGAAKTLGILIRTGFVDSTIDGYHLTAAGIRAVGRNPNAAYHQTASKEYERLGMPESARSERIDGVVSRALGMPNPTRRHQVTRNPGAAWHDNRARDLRRLAKESYKAGRNTLAAQDIEHALEADHSARVSRRMGMPNPTHRRHMTKKSPLLLLGIAGVGLYWLLNRSK